MNNSRHIIVTIAVALAVALGVSFFVGRRPVPPEGLGRPEVPEGLGRPEAQRESGVPERPLGAIPGTEVSGNSFTIGGITRHYASAGLRTASSTTCVLPAPRATSTLEYVGVVLSNGLTSGSFAIWKTSGSIATTSSGHLFSEAVKTVTTGLQQTVGYSIIATGTGNTILQNMTFATTSYLVFTTDVNFSGGGRCEAVWVSPF